MLMVQAELSMQLAWLRRDEAERRALASNPAWATAQRCEAWMTYRPVILRELSAFDTSVLLRHYMAVGDSNEANIASRLEDKRAITDHHDSVDRKRARSTSTPEASHV
jgi:hypothetical protein